MRISDWSSDVCSSDLLAGMTTEPIALGHVAAHWDVLLRFATSIRTGTVTASAMLRRLSGYPRQNGRSEEHTSELQSLMRISYAVFCLKKKILNKQQNRK